MSRKILFITITLLIIVLMFTACSSETNNSEPVAQTNNRSEESVHESAQTSVSDTTVAPADTKIVYDQINPGDYISFGSYEQDNDTTNGSEPIDWLVLDKKDSKALIISRYGLDAKVFHKECVEVTWESCDLRGWLNDTFYREAFTVDEQNQIAETIIKDEYVPDNGHDIIDKVFLLSYSEAEQLFENDAARKCVPTDYAKAQGAASYGDDDTCEWWLRSIGKKEWDATLVINNGRIHEYGSYVNSESYSVRPALWMQLGSSDQNMTESDEENTQPVSSHPKTDDIHINFERFTDGNIQVEGHNGAEYAKITATDSNGSVLWTYQTEMNAMGQAWSVEDIGMHNGMYYYYEKALGIVTLDLYTGEVIWVANASSGNIGTQFDEDGNLYCIGFESPLYVISPDGTILHSINLGEKGYYDVGIKCIWGGGVFVESMITMAGPEALLYIDLKTEEITECQYINNQEDRFSPTGNYRVYRTDYLWVYKEPRITAEKLGKINAGEIVAVNTSKHYAGWTNGFCEIEYQGGRAYAFPSYLEYVDGGMIFANIETDVRVSDITVYGWPDENAEILGVIENGTIWLVGYNEESDFVLVQCEFGMGYIREHFDLS